MRPINYGLAHSASWDAGNRAMRADCRITWNEDDYAIAARVMNDLLQAMDAEVLRDAQAN